MVSIYQQGIAPFPWYLNAKETDPNWKHLSCTHFASWRGSRDMIASLDCVRLTGWPVACNWRRAVLLADTGLLGLKIVLHHLGCFFIPSTIWLESGGLLSLVTHIGLTSGNYVFRWQQQFHVPHNLLCLRALPHLQRLLYCRKQWRPCSNSLWGLYSETEGSSHISGPNAASTCRRPHLLSYKVQRKAAENER